MINVFGDRTNEAISLLLAIDAKMSSLLNHSQILETKVMSALTDVQGALTQLTTDTTTLITLAEANANTGGIAQADAEAIAANITALDAQVQAAITAAQGAAAPAGNSATSAPAAS